MMSGLFSFYIWSGVTARSYRPRLIGRKRPKYLGIAPGIFSLCLTTRFRRYLGTRKCSPSLARLTTNGSASMARLTVYAERVEARPAVQKTLTAEGLA
jgi:hypothetical protein